MADDPRNRQRLEDMLKGGEPPAPSPGAGAQEPPSRPPTSGPPPLPEEPSPAPHGGEPGRPRRATGKADSRATAGLITGGLSIPGAFIALLGLVLGVIAIVLGTLVRREFADVRGRVAQILGAIGVVASIVSAVIGVMALTGDDGGSGEGGDAIASCFEDAGLADVEQPEVSEAEDVGALQDAAEDADEYVSAADSAGRAVYVLVFEDEDGAEDADSEIRGDREVGVRGTNLVLFSAAIGPEDRVALEECFLKDD